MTAALHPPTPRRVGILGGMGPAAGADFVRLFVAACDAHLRRSHLAVHDQAYPAHWLAQVPAPDRTAALLHGGASPLPAMADALAGLAQLGVTVAAIACNTAHAWHAELQRRAPGVTLLHIVGETVAHLHRSGVQSVGLLATQGTYALKLYDGALQQAGIACHLPLPAEQAQVMRGIEQGVKAGDLALARACFDEVAHHMVARHGCTALLLACTEIPLALHAVAQFPAVALVNPAQVLAEALARHAYAPGPGPAVSAG